MLEQNMKNNIIQGSAVPEIPKLSGTKFGGFKPEAEKRIAQALVIWATWLTLINS